MEGVRKITLAAILQLIKRAEDLSNKEDLEGLTQEEKSEFAMILSMEFFVQ